MTETFEVGDLVVITTPTFGAPGKILEIIENKDGTKSVRVSRLNTDFEEVEEVLLLADDVRIVKRYS